jgi:hypothetical protein
MSTTLSTRPSRQSHPPRHRHLAERPAQPVRRVSLIDQAALRLGLLLIMWGRRANQVSRAQHSARFEQQDVRERRELHAERMHRMSTPRL